MMWWWRVVDALEALRPGVGRAMPWSVPHSSTWPALGAVVAATLFLGLASVAGGLLPLADAGPGTSAAGGSGGRTTPAPSATVESSPTAPVAPPAPDAPTTIAAPTDAPTSTTTPHLPPSGTYAWLHETGGEPVTWDCGPIAYRLVIEGAPTGAESFVTDAMQHVSGASGNTITFTPAPAVATWQEAQGAWDGISVGWTSEGWQGSVAGTAETRSSTSELQRALVRLRLGKHYSEVLTFEPEGLGPILMHEIAHAVGLGHVDQSIDSLMTPANTNLAEFTDTDESALRYLGWSACAAS